jgi:putative sigma-54 modulation protein
VLVTVSSRHMDVSTALKEYAEQKTSKLTRYYDRIQEIEVVFDNAKDAMRVEMIVNAEHRNMFIAHDSQEDAYACIDGCIDKLERQLSDHKKKFRNRKHSAGEDKHAMGASAAGLAAAASGSRRFASQPRSGAKKRRK